MHARARRDLALQLHGSLGREAGTGAVDSKFKPCMNLVFRRVDGSSSQLSLAQNHVEIYVCGTHRFT